MKLQNLLFVLLLLVQTVYLQGSNVEQGWKGISVFKTNRQEVTKILGPPTTSDALWTTYKIDTATVAITFSAAPCSKATAGRGDFNVPEGTVIEFIVSMKPTLPLSKLNLKKDQYESAPDLHQPNLVSYYNPTVGLTILTDKSNGEAKVGSLWYIGGAKIKRKLRCS
jgi:hypothetical protein